MRWCCFDARSALTNRQTDCRALSRGNVSSGVHLSCDSSPPADLNVTRQSLSWLRQQRATEMAHRWVAEQEQRSAAAVGSPEPKRLWFTIGRQLSHGISSTNSRRISSNGHRRSPVWQRNGGKEMTTTDARTHDFVENKRYINVAWTNIGERDKFREWTVESRWSRKGKMMFSLILVTHTHNGFTTGRLYLWKERQGPVASYSFILCE